MELTTSFRAKRGDEVLASDSKANVDNALNLYHSYSSRWGI